MPGTFIVRPTALVSGGTPLVDSAGPFFGVVATYYDDGVVPILDAFNGALCGLTALAAGDGISQPASFDNTCRFSFSGASIYLDGSLVPISAGSLPAGFTALAAAVVISEAIPLTSGGVDPIANYYLQLDAGNDGTVNTPSYAYGVIPPLFSTILANGIGVRSDLFCDFENNSSIAYSSGFPAYNPTDLHLEGTYDIIIVTGAWYLHPTQGYQFFATDPGGPWVVQATAPSLDDAIGALQQQPCPWFFPTYIIRLTDPAVYADLIATYGLGPTPILLGLSPNDAVTITGAPLNIDPSDAAQSVWPQVYVDPLAPFVLGVGISLADGGGTVAVSYATPFGRPCAFVLWKWQALVVLEPLGITYDPVTNPAPSYTSAVVPVGDAVPDGALLTGGPGFGNNPSGGSGGGNIVSITPCGCPPE